MSKRMRSGVTNAVAALAVVIVISAAAVSIFAFQSTSGNRTAITTLTSNHTTTLTQASTTIFAQASTTTLTQVSTVTSTLISVSTVTATTTSSTTSTTTNPLGSAQISVLGQSLFALDFTAAGTTTTFTCASAPSSAYMTLTNSGTVSASVTSLSITWMGANTAFTLSGSCNFGGTGTATATQYIIFPATTRMTPDAIAGRAYTGTIVLSNGAQLLFSGNWAQ